jgi:hypothetical protein
MKSYTLEHHVAVYDRGEQDLELVCWVAFSVADGGRIEDIIVILTDDVRADLHADVILLVESDISDELRANPEILLKHAKMVDLYRLCTSNTIQNDNNIEHN